MWGYAASDEILRRFEKNHLVGSMENGLWAPGWSQESRVGAPGGLDQDSDGGSGHGWSWGVFCT